jgi:predicted N-acetyltransferase YhbS
MGCLSAPAPLASKHQTAEFECGADSLNEWLNRRALKNKYHGGSRTYVACEGNRVVGYYALAAGSIARKGAPGRLKRNMPDPIPALILGRLAIDLQWQRQGIGPGLLRDAIARSINVSKQIGARVLIVHALNGKAEEFYHKYGFVKSRLALGTLLLPLLIAEK